MTTWQSQIEADRAAEQLYHAYFVVTDTPLGLPEAVKLFGLPLSEGFWVEDGSIEAMRQFLRISALKAQSGEFRLGLVPDMGALSLPAEQAFLKPLEEPSSGTRFLLFSHLEPRLATTASRVRVLRDRASGHSNIEEGRGWLTKLEQLSLSQAFLAAKELADDEKVDGMGLAIVQATMAEPVSAEREKRLRAARDYYQAAKTNASKRLQLEKLILRLRAPKN